MIFGDAMIDEGMEERTRRSGAARSADTTDSVSPEIVGRGELIDSGAVDGPTTSEEDSGAVSSTSSKIDEIAGDEISEYEVKYTPPGRTRGSRVGLWRNLAGSLGNAKMYAGQSSELRAVSQVRIKWYV